ncbi:MAG: PorV/PorQ family protein, partial [Elusimicrobia bacterium]|nr:PorV/PorQ family protein [Elusimicrobiota bacterium]
AGLARIPKASLTFMHNRYLGDINYQYAAYAQRINDMAVIGGSFRYMDAGSIPSTDINGNTAGYFHPQNFVWDFGWGQYITDLSDADTDVTMGAVARYAHSDLVEHGDIFAGDLGMQTHHFSAFLPWRFGAAVQNFGRGPKYDEKRERLPVRGKFGAAIEPCKFWVVSMDGTLGVAHEPSVALGTEVTLDTGDVAKAFLRAGIDTLALTHGLDGFRAASFGLGIKTLQFSFDYAFSAFGDLGNVHRFSISFNFPQKGGAKRYRER